VAVKKDGTLLGIKSRIIADLGAYLQLLTPAIPTLTGLMLAGCYKCKAVSIAVTGRLYAQDGHRRPIAARAARSHLRHRATHRPHR